MRKVVFVALLVAALALCASQAFADRLILTPTGSVLGRGEVKAEAAFGSVEVDDPDIVGDFEPKFDVSRYWVNVGLGQFEIEASRIDVDGVNATDVFGIQAAVMPETLLTPGLAVGVSDITDEIERGYYAAVSKTVPATDKVPFLLHDVKVHAGYGLNGTNEGLFAGLQVGLPMKLTLSAEHDGDAFNGALSWNIIPMVGLKLYMLDDEIFYGASFKSTF